MTMLVQLMLERAEDGARQRLGGFRIELERDALARPVLDEEIDGQAFVERRVIRTRVVHVRTGRAGPSALALDAAVERDLEDVVGAHFPVLSRQARCLA